MFKLHLPMDLSRELFDKHEEATMHIIEPYSWKDSMKSWTVTAMERKEKYLKEKSKREAK